MDKLKIICEYSQYCDKDDCYAIKAHEPRGGDRSTCIYPNMEVSQILYDDYLWYREKIKNITYFDIQKIETLVNYFIDQGYKHNKSTLRMSIFDSLLNNDVIEQIKKSIERSLCHPFDKSVCDDCNSSINKCYENNQKLDGH